MSTLSENFEKAVNDMKVQNRYVHLLHEKLRFSKPTSRKNEVTKSLMEIPYSSLSVAQNDPTILQYESPLSAGGLNLLPNFRKSGPWQDFKRGCWEWGEVTFFGRGGGGGGR